MRDNVSLIPSSLLCETYCAGNMPSYNYSHKDFICTHFAYALNAAGGVLNILFRRHYIFSGNYNRVSFSSNIITGGVNILPDHLNNNSGGLNRVTGGSNIVSRGSNRVTSLLNIISSDLNRVSGYLNIVFDGLNIVSG